MHDSRCQSNVFDGVAPPGVRVKEVSTVTVSRSEAKRELKGAERIGIGRRSVDCPAIDLSPVDLICHVPMAVVRVLDREKVLDISQADRRLDVV